MNYGTLMVHLELGKSNAALLNVAGDLAERCNASILAVTAYQPLVASPATVGVVFRETVECDDAEVEREAQAAKAECRDLLAKRVKHLEWSCASVSTSLAKYIAGEARSADLILTTPVAIGALLPNTRQAHTGDLVMNAGRPVLLVPPTTTSLNLDHVVLAWKDSREARRAASDALALFKLAGKVTVAGVARRQEADAAGEAIADVVRWLAVHGVAASPCVKVFDGSEIDGIAEITHELRANVVVAGAYGHSRLHEWVLGGVTMDLLLNCTRPTLLSH